jgi:hypothetical protein
MAWSYKGGINLPGYDPLKVANAPTIGTATAGGSLRASVTFTAPACVGGGAISSYTVFANCGAKVADWRFFTIGSNRTDCRYSVHV